MVFLSGLGKPGRECAEPGRHDKNLNNLRIMLFFGPNNHTWAAQKRLACVVMGCKEELKSKTNTKKKEESHTYFPRAVVSMREENCSKQRTLATVSGT